MASVASSGTTRRGFFYAATGDVGQSVTFKWREQPVFVRNRTKEEIATAASQTAHIYDISLKPEGHDETNC